MGGATTPTYNKSHPLTTATPTYLHHSIVQEPRDNAEVATDLLIIKHDTILASSLASSSTISIMGVASKTCYHWLSYLHQ